MKSLYLGMIISCPLFAASDTLEIPHRSLLASGDVRLFHGVRGFEVQQGDRHYNVSSLDLDPALRQVKQENIRHYLAAGKIGITKASDGSYLLRSHIGGNGGFLLTGVIVYQTTRILGHASIVVAAGASIAGAFVAGGPALAAGAYINALAAVPTAMATVESGSLALGTAASFIPGLP